MEHHNKNPKNMSKKELLDAHKKLELLIDKDTKAKVEDIKKMYGHNPTKKDEEAFKKLDLKLNSEFEKISAIENELKNKHIKFKRYESHDVEDFDGVVPPAHPAGSHHNKQSKHPKNGKG